MKHSWEAMRLEWTNTQPQAIQPWPWARQQQESQPSFSKTASTQQNQHAGLARAKPRTLEEYSREEVTAATAVEWPTVVVTVAVAVAATNRGIESSCGGVSGGSEQSQIIVARRRRRTTTTAAAAVAAAAAVSAVVVMVVVAAVTAVIAPLYPDPRCLRVCLYLFTPSPLVPSPPYLPPPPQLRHRQTIPPFPRALFSPARL